MTDVDNRPAVVGQVERPVRPDPERAAFEAWAAKRWGREAHRHTSATCAEWDAWQAAAASVRERDATPDQIIELSEALQVRRILEEVKKVAAIHPAGDMPTPFQAAWQQCCDEIFFRATGEEWHMDEDADRFARRPAAAPGA